MSWSWPRIQAMLWVMGQMWSTFKISNLSCFRLESTFQMPHWGSSRTDNFSREKIMQGIIRRKLRVLLLNEASYPTLLTRLYGYITMASKNTCKKKRQEERMHSWSMKKNNKTLIKRINEEPWTLSCLLRKRYWGNGWSIPSLPSFHKRMSTRE